jgi:hypothetical protein
LGLRYARISCPSTAAWGYLRIMALEIVYLLGPSLLIALPDAVCLHVALLRDCFSDTTFSHDTFFTQRFIAQRFITQTLRRSFQ